MQEFVEIDPSELHLPPSRVEGADPGKLQRQISRYGVSMNGMPPILVWRGTDDHFMITNGVTRATRVAKLLPGQQVTVEVIATLRTRVGRFPTIGEKLP
jgi:hypothetical protein